MDSLLYTSKARGKYILKKTSWQKICPFYENTHLWQFPKVDNQYVYTIGGS